MKNFKVLNEIGRGAFSVVYKVIRNGDGLVYALKKVLSSIYLRSKWDNLLPKKERMHSMRFVF